MAGEHRRCLQRLKHREGDQQQCFAAAQPAFQPCWLKDVWAGSSGAQAGAVHACMHSCAMCMCP